ncbi:MAG: hypothetical protein QM804_15695 [Propionicimonas sp.]
MAANLVYPPPKYRPVLVSEVEKRSRVVRWPPEVRTHSRSVDREHLQSELLTPGAQAPDLVWLHRGNGFLDLALARPELCLEPHDAVRYLNCPIRYIMSISVPADLYEWAVRTGRYPVFEETICSGGEWEARCALDQLRVDYGLEMIQLARNMLGFPSLLLDDDVGIDGAADRAAGMHLDRLMGDFNGRRGQFDDLVDYEDDATERVRSASRRVFETPPRPANLDPARLPDLYGGWDPERDEIRARLVRHGFHVADDD